MLSSLKAISLYSDLVMTTKEEPLSAFFTMALVSFGACGSLFSFGRWIDLAGIGGSRIRCSRKPTKGPMMVLTLLAAGILMVVVEPNVMSALTR